jgi:scyllo-inositol 2-dehydrogenase (NADP+)
MPFFNAHEENRMKQFKKASDIKVGVVGYGGAFNMGKRHLDEMQKAGMTPVAVVEIDSYRRQVAKNDFPGIETYDSVTAMLKASDVNMVTLITPHNTHAQLGLQCLRAGKSICSEKPLTITTAECDALIREAKKQDCILTTYHNRHWDGCILEAVNQIKKKGVIGDVYKAKAHMGNYAKPRDWWRSSKSISGGITYDWGVHLLEYALQIMDGNIQEVSGYMHEGFWKTKWKADTFEDEGSLMVRFDNGNWLSVTISQLDSNPHPHFLEFTGTKGTYLMNHSGYSLIQNRGSKRVTTEGKNPPSEGWRFYQNVADHMVKGTELIISPEWSRRPVHILDLGDKSARSGKALKSKYA